MKKLVLTAAMLVCLLGSGCCNVLTVKVVDAETGVPVQGASVMLQQSYFLSAGMGWGRGATHEWTKETDSSGRCTFVEDIDSSMKLMVWKPGPGAYYMGWGDWYRLGSHDEPWPVESVTMRLKKRGLPHRMYSHWIRMGKHRTDDGWRHFFFEECPTAEFDFVAGDFLPPNGEGKHADVVMSLSWEDVGDGAANAAFDVVFKDDGCGLVRRREDDTGSVMKMPALAPQDGYEPRLTHRLQWTWEGHEKPQGRPKNTVSDKNHYYFRIRERDGNGGVTGRFLYGRVLGDFNMAWWSTFQLFYLLNVEEPDEHNTESGLSDMEWPQML